MAKQQPDNIEKHSDNDNEETNAEERDVEKTVGESTGECNGDKSSSVDKTQMVCKSDKDLDHRGDDSSLTKPRECKVGCSASPTTPITSVTFPANVASVLKPPGDDASPLCDATLPPSLADNGTESTKRRRLTSTTTDVEFSHTPATRAHTETEHMPNVAVDLSKKPNKQPKRKRKKHLLSKLEVQRAKDFIYCSENEQYSVEKLRTMVEDLTEFLDAIWDVYCSEARQKGKSVAEEGGRAAAVLRCVSSSGEGSWGDLQLLSRAKSVLVLRSKKLAASTISMVENQLGFDTDVKSFIVRLLKFWMDKMVTKG